MSLIIATQCFVNTDVIFHVIASRRLAVNCCTCRLNSCRRGKGAVNTGMGEREGVVGQTMVVYGAGRGMTTPNMRHKYQSS